MANRTQYRPNAGAFLAILTNLTLPLPSNRYLVAFANEKFAANTVRIQQLEQQLSKMPTCVPPMHTTSSKMCARGFKGSGRQVVQANNYGFKKLGRQVVQANY
jgi:hypothetical protein